MPLEPDDQHHLTVAQGYAELGMFLDADSELEEIDPDVRHVPEVLTLRIQIFGALKKWELTQTVAKKMAQFDPDDPQWTVSWSYATRCADSIEAARLILVNAVERLPDVAIFHYNLACYDCQLGRLEDAKARLTRAFELDAKLRFVALDDEDLEPLWDFFLTPVERLTPDAVRGGAGLDPTQYEGIVKHRVAFLNDVGKYASTPPPA